MSFVGHSPGVLLITADEVTKKTVKDLFIPLPHKMR